MCGGRIRKGDRVEAVSSCFLALVLKAYTSPVDILIPQGNFIAVDIHLKPLKIMECNVVNNKLCH